MLRMVMKLQSAIAENRQVVWTFVYDYIEYYPAYLPLKDFKPEELPEPEKTPNK